MREAAVKVGGNVQLSTGVFGTNVDITIPMALAAVDAFVVEDSRMSAGIAVDSVSRAVRVTPAMLVRSPGGTRLSLDGATMPFAWLSELLGGAPREAGKAFTALVVKGQTLGAIGVERVHGRQDMLLRSLPPLAPARAVVAGVALDAHGEPMLVLDTDAAVAAAENIAPVVSEKASRLPILVVDDSLTTRMLEQNILESAGYEVELATCAEEGLEKARRRRYGLFLVDVDMPGMDGFSFVEHARAAPETQAVPAILITSRNAPEDRERGVRAGAQDYMVKSEFDQSKLLARIRALME